MANDLQDSVNRLRHAGQCAFAHCVIEDAKCLIRILFPDRHKGPSVRDTIRGAAAEIRRAQQYIADADRHYGINESDQC